MDTGHLAQEVLVPNQVPSPYPGGIGRQLKGCCWLHPKPSSGHGGHHLNPASGKCANPPCDLFLQIMSQSEDLGTVFMNI